ncbi:MAG: Kelch repeat-containing protein, partial [Acidimicrobiales bacterium]
VLARTEVYDPGEGSWRAAPDLALPREHLAVAATGDRVYAIAGRAGSLDNFRVVQSFDPRRDREWRHEPDVADSRGGTAAAAVDGRVCVAGGEEPAGTIATVECLDGERWVRAARLARPRHGLAVMALDGRLHAVAGGERPGLFVSGAHEAFDL